MERGGVLSTRPMALATSVMERIRGTCSTQDVVLQKSERAMARSWRRVCGVHTPCTTDTSGTSDSDTSASGTTVETSDSDTSVPETIASGSRGSPVSGCDVTPCVNHSNPELHTIVARVKLDDDVTRLILMRGQSLATHDLFQWIEAVRQLRRADVLRTSELTIEPCDLHACTLCLTGPNAEIDELQIGIGAQAAARTRDVFYLDIATRLGAASRAEWTCTPAIRSRCGAAAGPYEGHTSLLDTLGMLRLRMWAPVLPDVASSYPARMCAHDAAAVIVASDNPLDAAHVRNWEKRISTTRRLYMLAQRIHRAAPTNVSYGWNGKGELHTSMQNLAPRSDPEAWQLRAIFDIYIANDTRSDPRQSVSDVVDLVCETEHDHKTLTNDATFRKRYMCQNPVMTTQKRPCTSTRKNVTVAPVTKAASWLDALYEGIVDMTR